MSTFVLKEGLKFSGDTNWNSINLAGAITFFFSFALLLSFEDYCDNEFESIKFIYWLILATHSIIF